MQRKMLFLAAAALLAPVMVQAEPAEGPRMVAPQDDGTTVIGAEEAPTVLNVVPWKDSRVELERDDPSSALLSRVLEPLDREVLQREIQYHQMMNISDEDDGLFLD